MNETISKDKKIKKQKTKIKQLRAKNEILLRFIDFSGTSGIKCKKCESTLRTSFPKWMGYRENATSDSVTLMCAECGDEWKPLDD